MPRSRLNSARVDNVCKAKLDSIALRLQGQSPEVADNILKMAQGVVAMAQLAAQEQPKLSELAKNVTVTRDDKVVQGRFEAPAQSVFASLKEQWQKKQQPQTPPTKAP